MRSERLSPKRWRLWLDCGHIKEECYQFLGIPDNVTCEECQKVAAAAVGLLGV